MQAKCIALAIYQGLPLIGQVADHAMPMHLLHWLDLTEQKQVVLVMSEWPSLLDRIDRDEHSLMPRVPRA